MKPYSPFNKANNLRSRGSTHRTPTKPLGRSDSACVRLGNLLCARALILVVLAASKGCFWVLEQPMSSVMEHHPLFQAVIKLLGMRKLLISMSKYGGPTEKKTLLYASSSVYFHNDGMCFCLGSVLVLVMEKILHHSWGYEKVMFLSKLIEWCRSLSTTSMFLYLRGPSKDTYV